MNMTPQGRFVLIRLEGGPKTQMYRDNAGLPTIGVGHLLTRSELSSGKILINGRPVRWAPALAIADVDALFAQDLQQVVGIVSSTFAPIGVYTPAQFDAIVSFTFNVGIPAYLGSTLLKKLRARMFGEIPAQLERWIYSGGVVNKGLKNRRKAEIEMWHGRYPGMPAPAGSEKA